MSVQTMILAAGHGTRMKSELPKVMHAYHGMPLVGHAVAVAKTISHEKPIVVVSPTSTQIREYLGDSVVYAVQETQLGTGHAVQSGLSALPLGATTLIVLYGDMPRVSPDSLTRLLRAHEENGAVLSMLTAITPNFDDWRSAFLTFGKVLRDDSGAIQKIIEYKDASDEEKTIRELSTCLFCFDIAWLKDHITKLENHNAQNEYYLVDLLELAVNEHAPIATTPIPLEEVVGVNSQEDLKQAHTIALS